MRGRVQIMLLTAIALPLFVALAEIGRGSETMLPENTAGSVGAGVLSVIVFPAVAVNLARSGAPTRPDPGARRQLPPPLPCHQATLLFARMTMGPRLPPSLMGGSAEVTLAATPGGRDQRARRQDVDCPPRIRRT